MDELNLKNIAKNGDIEQFKKIVHSGDYEVSDVVFAFLHAATKNHLNIIKYIHNNIDQIFKPLFQQDTYNENIDEAEEQLAVQIIFKHQSNTIASNMFSIFETSYQAIYKSKDQTPDGNFNSRLFTDIFCASHPIDEKMINYLTDKMGFNISYGIEEVFKKATNENLSYLIKASKNKTKKIDLIFSEVGSGINKPVIFFDTNKNKRLEHFYKLDEHDAKNLREIISKKMKEKLSLNEMKKFFNTHLTIIQENKALNQIDLTQKPNKILKL